MDRSSRCGVRQLDVWVFDDSWAANRAYRLLGLRPTRDDPQPLAGRWTHKLRLPVG